MDKEEYKKIRRKYKNHRANAFSKNVNPLSFEQYVAKMKEADIKSDDIGRQIDKYQLCRYTDQGDYKPESCRFDTMKINLSEKLKNGGFKRSGEKLKEQGIKPTVTCLEVTGEYPNSKEYCVKSPNGEIYKGINFAKICREQGFTNRVYDMLNGKLKSYRGWTLA